MPENASWEVGFHLRSPKKWLNDPNGLSYFKGRYRFYYQYNSQWPHASQKAWGLFSSPDLLRWDYEGIAIEPSIEEDRHGVYSGCCRVEQEAGQEVLRAYYTGNVIDLSEPHHPHDTSFAHDCRSAYQIRCTSLDGRTFEGKDVLLSPADYPTWATRHVRDPFLFEREGSLWMLLGCRHETDRGQLLLFRSENDGESWSYARAIDSVQPFGYMWECPNLVTLAGRDYLAFCPQGLPRLYDRWQSLWQAGYVPLADSVLETATIDERGFLEWDLGHDFYAPQVFCAPDGRWLLVGWLGGFDRSQEAAPDGLGWAHCLTVPRELTQDEATGVLLQRPIKELEGLRRDGHALLRGATVRVTGRHADVTLESISGPGTLTFDDDLQLAWDGAHLTLRYLTGCSGRGRLERSFPVRDLRDLRVLIDGSVVEVFGCGGALALATRWFNEGTEDLSITSTFTAQGAAWRMTDVMENTYASAQAPDIALPGWNARA